MMLVRIIENNAYFRVGYVMQRLAFPLRARTGIRIGLRSVRAPCWGLEIGKITPKLLFINLDPALNQ